MEDETVSDVKWVQHISGQGQKWEIAGNHPLYEWYVKSAIPSVDSHFLPKSEFIACDPPEQWEDVTEDSEMIVEISTKLLNNYAYRIRKITGIHNGAAFIVERRKL